MSQAEYSVQCRLTRLGVESIGDQLFAEWINQELEGRVNDAWCIYCAQVIVFPSHLANVCDACSNKQVG